MNVDNKISINYTYDYHLNYEIVLDEKKYTTKGLSGLINLGNKCFLNSIIQCLSNTLKLSDYFLSNDVKKDIKKNGVNFTTTYIKLLTNIWENNQVIKPKSFIDYCSKEFSNYNKSEQEDSFECLLYILDYLHKDISYKLDIDIVGTVENDFDKLMKDSILYWESLYKNDFSIINELFYGLTFNKLSCNDCNNTLKIFESYNSISLHTPQNENSNIYDLLDNYFKDSEDIIFTCDACKKSDASSINRKIWTFPDHVIIHLKRFTNTGQKINTMIEFPLDELNITKYISKDKNDPNNYIYSLYAVNYHNGNDIDTGHYYSSCKNLDNNWYAFNDENVSKYHNNTHIITKDAYILFYYRKFIKK